MRQCMGRGMGSRITLHISARRGKPFKNHSPNGRFIAGFVMPKLFAAWWAVSNI